MGLTGFNLARRKAEAAEAASLSCPAPEATAPAVEQQKPKRTRRAAKAAVAPVEHPTWSEVKDEFMASIEAEAPET